MTMIQMVGIVIMDDKKIKITMPMFTRPNNLLRKFQI
jgi:hypothetical protein